MIETTREHGLLVLASGTQPLALWDQQQQTRKECYDRLIQQMQMLGQRNVLCGMHVHVEVPRPAERVDLMNRMLPFTPLLLALSASSPFWQGRDTGLAAYRLSVWGEMPRTGLPDLFEDAAEYERYVAAMTRAGAITDASFLCGPCGLRSAIPPWSYSSPMAARGWTTRWALPRCIAAWGGCWIGRRR